MVKVTIYISSMHNIQRGVIKDCPHVSLGTELIILGVPNILIVQSPGYTLSLLEQDLNVLRPLFVRHFACHTNCLERMNAKGIK